MAIFSTSLVLTAVAFVVLMFIRQVFLAVPVLALVSALVNASIRIFFLKLQFGEFLSPEDAVTSPGLISPWWGLAPSGTSLSSWDSLWGSDS